jgi:hypothetical protein
MDKDGSRRGRDASNANRVRNLRAATSKAARELKDIKPAKEHLDWAKNWQKAQESRIGQEMKGTIYHDDLKRKISDAKKEARNAVSAVKKETKEFMQANAIKRSLKINPRSKQSKLF